jgi:uncharacterized membrane protein
MRSSSERYTFVASNVSIALAVMLGVIAIIFQQVSLMERYEAVFSVIARLITAGVAITAFAGWILAIRYLLSRNRMNATPGEYVLLLVAIFMPLAAIYVLWLIRRREAKAQLMR